MTLKSVPQIAEFLGVPRSWVYSAVQKEGRNRLPHFRVGKHLRFDLEAVIAWLRGQTDVQRRR